MSDQSSFPKINIYHSWFLNSVFEEAIRAHKGKDWQPPSPRELEASAREYKEEWKEYEGDLLAGMCDFLGLKFAENIIDAHIVVGRGAFSNPVVIGADTKKEDFVDILTHELIHHLLTKNTKELDIKSIWKKMFPNVEDRKTKNHILVHAVHKHIYLDVFKDKSRLDKNIEKDKENQPYKKSWDIVEEEGYKNIIEKFKSH